MRGRNTLVLLVVVLMVAAPLASAWPTPGFNGEAARQVTGRIFPEARQTNDFVSYQEARDGLQLLEEENPDLLEFVDVGRSVGWMDPMTQERSPNQVFAVLVTNEESGVPERDRVNHLFQLSIHGDEKGGREGALRVIEDFVLAQQTGDDVGVATQERLAMLDRMRLIFTFPNPDGWVHEELAYRWNDACYNSLTCEYSSGNDQAGGVGVERNWYTRVNGNGTDLNRQAPVLGLIAEDHRTMEEPETRGLFKWLQEEFHRVHYAADLHGMGAPADSTLATAKDGVCTDAGPLGEVCTKNGHFVLGLLPAGPFGPARSAKITALAERADTYINEDPAFDVWRTVPPLGPVGGEPAAWGTVWDTIGYTDTGFTGDWMAQPHGLNAVGVYYEFAYNNENVDNHYVPAGQEINRLHIAATRDIVGAFMDVAHEETPVSVDPAQTRVGYVPTDVVETREPGSLADLEAYKRRFAVADYRATPNEAFDQVRASLVDPSALRRVPAGSLGAGGLDGLEVLVVAGSAVGTLTDDDRAAVRAFVEDGGRLVVTDEALTLLADLGVDAGVDQTNVFAGHTQPDRSHWLMEDVRGLARQLVEPVPIGYEPGQLPLWSLDADRVESAGGEVAGTSPSADRASLGVVPVGEGDVVFIGAFVPDPFTEEHHPYGLADHGLTYTAHQVLRNALGWAIVEGPVEPGSIPGDAGGEVLPAPGVAWVVAGVGAAVLVVAGVRRRRG